MVTQAKAFADHYAGLPDEDLQRLSLDVQSLLPEARQALHAEMERRHIAAASINWQPPPAPEAGDQPATRDEERAMDKRALTRNLILFYGFEILCLVMFGVLLPGADQIGAGSLVYYIFKWGLLLILILGSAISRFPVPQRMKILLILGVCVPVALFILLAALS
jgi:hypothetical protein